MNGISTQSITPLLSGLATATPVAPNSRDESQQPKGSQEIEKAAKDFEAMFVSMLIKQLRETLQEGLFTKETSDSFGAMFDMYMGEHLAESSPLGIGKAVSKYMEAQKSQ